MKSSRAKFSAAIRCSTNDNAYRFNPMKITPQDLAGFHGTNERISLENLVRATRFYIELIKNDTN